MMEYYKLPNILRIGMSYSWTETIDDYPSSSYTAKYSVVQRGAGALIIANANSDELRYDFEIGISTFAGFEAGDANYMLFVENTTGTKRYEIRRGVVTLLPDITDGTAMDIRSHTKKVLDALESLILGKATADQISISIAGVSVSRMSPDDIIRWYNFYKAKYEEEKLIERMEQGESVSTSILVKL